MFGSFRYTVGLHEVGLSRDPKPIEADSTCSWNQRFQNETAEMLSTLNQRLRDMDDNQRHMWRPYGPMGSVSSSNGSIGSISYHSPPNSLSVPPMMYQTTPPPMRQTPSFGENSAPRYQPSPGLFQQQSHMHTQQQQYQQHQPAHHQAITTSSNYAAVPPQHYQPQPHQNFNLNEAPYHNASFVPPPSQQFAAWTGYGGPTVASKLDEDNAVPPNTNPWDLNK